MHFLPTPSKRWFSTATSAVKHNVFIRNSETAAKVAEAFVPAGTKDKVVIEAFPGTMDFPDPPSVGLTIILVGPGILTRALLQLPRERIRKIIVLENAECFLDSLRVRQCTFPFVAAR